MTNAAIYWATKAITSTLWSVLYVALFIWYAARTAHWSTTVIGMIVFGGLAIFSNRDATKHLFKLADIAEIPVKERR